MQRSITILLLITLSTTTILSAHAAKPTINVTIPDTPTPAQFNLVDDNFIGISFELSSFDTLWGKDTKSIPTAMQNYLSNIRLRMSSPLRIRVGGNGMDGSTYNPSLQSTMLQLTDPTAYFNDIPADFGPVLFDVMNAMYDKVGKMQFLVGVSMRDPQGKFGNALELARDAERLLGERLDAMLLGNEPDLYAGHGERDAYNISAYIPEVGDLVQQLQGADLLKEKRIGGPTICCSWDLSDVLDAGYTKYPFKYYTVQHYPQHSCSGPNEKNTNISYYLSHLNVGDYVSWNQNGIDRGKELGVPVLLTEYNTVSCGGSNISSTFAATLWAIDAGLKSAASNFSAVYLHTREFDIQYNLFDPPSPTTSTSLNWRTGSPYYAALFLAEVTSLYGSVIIDLALENSTTSPSSTIASYSIYDDGGQSPGKLALINYSRNESRTFRLPANVTGDFVEYRVLEAGSVEERVEIRWAGQTVRENGILEGEQETRRVDCGDGCVVEVPGPGAVLVVLRPDSSDQFFRGNSTVAPWPTSSTSVAVVGLLEVEKMVVVSVVGVLVGVVLVVI